MEDPYSQKPSQGYAGGPNDPDAFENDFQQKQKLLRKWEKYFKLEDRKDFDVSAPLIFNCKSAGQQL